MNNTQTTKGRDMSNLTNFIVTRDEHGNDRVFAGCVYFDCTWTLIPQNMRPIKDAALAIQLAKDFASHDHSDGVRVVVADEHKGPDVRTTGYPTYNHIIL